MITSCEFTAKAVSVKDRLRQRRIIDGSPHKSLAISHALFHVLPLPSSPSFSITKFLPIPFPTIATLSVFCDRFHYCYIPTISLSKSKHLYIGFVLLYIIPCRTSRPSRYLFCHVNICWTYIHIIYDVIDVVLFFILYNICTY